MKEPHGISDSLPSYTSEDGQSGLRMSSPAIFFKSRVHCLLDIFGKKNTGKAQLQTLPLCFIHLSQFLADLSHPFCALEDKTIKNPNSTGSESHCIRPGIIRGRRDARHHKALKSVHLLQPYSDLRNGTMFTTMSTSPS